MLRLVLALLTIAMLSPLAACDDDPKVITTGQPGTVVVDDDD